MRAAAPSCQETAQCLGSCSLTLLGFPAYQGGFRGGSGWTRVCVIVEFLEIRVQDGGEAWGMRPPHTANDCELSSCLVVQRNSHCEKPLGS